jgi:mono/diheme cytochrome c family protein
MLTSQMKKLAMSSILCLILGIAAETRAANVAEGRAYYLRYCASCHGQNADGLGPVAPALKVHPPDLRRLSERYGTPLPAKRLEQYIDGREMVAVHGSRTMPVWGRRFEEAWTAKRAGEPEMKDQISRIVEYLDSIQLAGHPAGASPAANVAPSGQ